MISYESANDKGGEHLQILSIGDAGFRQASRGLEQLVEICHAPKSEGRRRANGWPAHAGVVARRSACVGAQGCELRGRGGRGNWIYREERRGEVYLTEDHLADHAAYAGAYQGKRQDRKPAGGGDRFSPGAYGPGEYIFEWPYAGNDAQGDRFAVRCHCRFFRGRNF